MSLFEMRLALCFTKRQQYSNKQFLEYEIKKISYKEKLGYCGFKKLIQ